MKKLLLVLVVIMVIGAVSGFIFYNQMNKTSYVDVTIGDTTFSAQLVANEADREKGLGGRQSLGENEGMLFKFPGNGFYSFWMKDMLIPLDIIWIQDTVIVDMQKDAPVDIPGTKPLVYTPINQANYVLEVSAGTAEQYGFKIGDSVTIK